MATTPARQRKAEAQSARRPPMPPAWPGYLGQARSRLLLLTTRCVGLGGLSPFAWVSSNSFVGSVWGFSVASATKHQGQDKDQDQVWKLVQCLSRASTGLAQVQSTSNGSSGYDPPSSPRKPARGAARCVPGGTDPAPTRPCRLRCSAPSCRSPRSLTSEGVRPSPL